MKLRDNIKENGIDKSKACGKESRLASMRKSAGMTQAQLAEASGLKIRQIQKYESGEYKTENMTAKNLLAIADVLGVDPHILL